MTTQKKSEFLTDKQAAEILGVSVTYLSHLRCTSRKTKLSYEKIGGHIYYLKEDVERYRDMRAEKKKHSRKKVKYEI